MDALFTSAIAINDSELTNKPRDQGHELEPLVAMTIKLVRG